MLKNPFIPITVAALVLQSVMLVLFYALPDPLGLSLSEMFSGKTLWQIFMAFGAILVLSALFAFAKKPRAFVVFIALYFIVAIVDYELFRFSHQRLSYSFLRTYFHWSNLTDATSVSTLGGDLKGTLSWIAVLLADLIGAAVLFAVLTARKKTWKFGWKIPVVFLSVGLALSVTPLILFLAGTRGIKTIPVLNVPVDMRFTLGKHTLTAPVLHIAAVETFEFVKDNYRITDALVADLDAFLPADFAANRPDVKNFPAYRNAPAYEYRAKFPYNIVVIFGESFKGRVLNQMLDGDTLLAPNLWKLANGGFFENGGGGLWFKNAFSGGYPTVRGTMATYLGFPSHPNRDVPSFYASNHFKGFPEFFEGYHRAYMTVSNPVFDHTLPFVEKFYGDNWRVSAQPTIPGTSDSLGVDEAIRMLAEIPADSSYLLTFNTIATHIPFYNYPDSFAEKPDDAMARYRNALRYTDSQLGRFFVELSKRPDFEKTVVVILGDHDTPVDSVDYSVPQPLGLATTRIFLGIFSADSNLFRGLEVRDDAASQLDIGPTLFDLAQVRAPHHFWGYDLLTQSRPAEQPTVFFSQNAYYLGFRDDVLTGGIENDEVFRGREGSFKPVTDSLSLLWRNRAVGASKVLRSLLRNDTMEPTL